MNMYSDWLVKRKGLGVMMAEEACSIFESKGKVSIKKIILSLKGVRI